MRELPIQEAKYFLAELADLWKQKVEEDVLSNAFFSALEEANTGLNNASCYFVESVHTEIVTNGFLEDMFERSMECRRNHSGS